MGATTCRVFVIDYLKVEINELVNKFFCWGTFLWHLLDIFCLDIFWTCFWNIFWTFVWISFPNIGVKYRKKIPKKYPLEFRNWFEIDQICRQLFLFDRSSSAGNQTIITHYQPIPSLLPQNSQIQLIFFPCNGSYNIYHGRFLTSICTLFKKRLELHWNAPELHRDAPELHRNALELHRNAPELQRNAPELSTSKVHQKCNKMHQNYNECTRFIKKGKHFRRKKPSMQIHIINAIKIGEKRSFWDWIFFFSTNFRRNDEVIWSPLPERKPY